MNFIDSSVCVDYTTYDYIVSIGNKCPTAMILRKLNIYAESFPFDYVPTTPRLILKYLKNQQDFFPKKNVVKTDDNVWFGHFNINDKYDQTIETFKRRFNRLFKILNDKKRVLFVYTSEADVYNEMGNRYNDNYTELTNIEKYIKETYNYTNFTIVAVHTNKTYTNTENIINYTINVPNEYLSDDMSTHTGSVSSMYRNTIESLFKHVFKKGI